VRALALHPDVLVVSSAVLHVNCVIVRGTVDAADGHDAQDAGSVGGDGSVEDGGAENPVRVIEPGTTAGSAAAPLAETFVIDSPVLPDELDALGALLGQARFPAPSGLLVTHGDWDHMLARLAFPGVALGASQSTAERMQANPGEAQRELRAFDEELMITRQAPLALGSVQALPVPGRCDVGDRELELHEATGHTPDGMAVMIPWAGVLVAGDYLSPLEIPMLNDGGDVDAYLATLERLRGLAGRASHVVPGHGPVLDSEQALEILEQDVAYLSGLGAVGAEAELPEGRRGAQQRAVHAQNVAAL
jgi:glyoxylase-like metal-dependent hydrolase (beta-lactamase superfamily II)